jgi:fusion and transport protein UGO1
METEYSPLSFKGMSTSRDAPNPLRPYYIPPSIGIPQDAPNSTSSGGRIPASSMRGGTDFRSSARDIFSDIDYETYLPERDGNSVADMAKRLVDQAIWNYTSVLLAQPFEVAKIVLQCNLAGNSAPLQLGAGSGDFSRRANEGYFDGRHHDVCGIHLIPLEASILRHEIQELDSDEESEDDAPSYFTPTAPFETPSSPHRLRRHKPPSRSLSATPTPSTRGAPSSYSSQHLIRLQKNDSLMEVLSQLWSKEGAWGIWKGTNSTFVYNVLLKTIETWTRSLLSALLNLPDPALLSIGPSTTPGGLSILDSPNPMAGIAVAVAAAGIAGLVLAPIDMIRTRYTLPLILQ